MWQMYTYRMRIAYDGTRYRGWQKQRNTDQTIQMVIEKALSQLLGNTVTISGSGRTDSGVHAFGQEASFHVKKRLESESVWKALNEKLPEDIRVLSFSEAPEGFHARKSAVGKCYEYYVDLQEKADVFSRRYSYHFPGKIDVDAMREAAEYLKGIHDFSSFTDGKEIDDTVRTIEDIQIHEEKERLIFSFYGDGFLYHMVRILTGTLLCVGKGQIAPAKVKEILLSKERKQAGFPAPAKGLFLKEVYYEERG